MNNKEKLEKILPHKRPMILIDDILSYSVEEKCIKAIVTINENCIFFDKTTDGVSPVVGIEYMAQTIGGYVFYSKNKKEPEMGFLLGTRVYNNNIEKFNNGESYTIVAKQEFYNDDIASFNCTIYDKDNNEAANAIVNAYQGDEIKKEFFNG